MKLTEPEITERKQLRVAKSLIVGVILLLIISPGKTYYWPFVSWSMYSSGKPKIPNSISRVELRVLDTAGQWHSLRPMDLYTLDDDTSNQRPGENIIRLSFEGQPQQWKIYRPYLVKHIETILGIEVATIQAWQYTWNLNFDVYPPLQLSQPQKAQKLGSFPASNYPIKSQER